MTQLVLETINELESLCDSGTWEYDLLDTSELSSQEIPADNLIRHWRVPRETAEFLYKTVLESKPLHILELGTSTGYSTLWLGAAAATYGGHIDTIDYFGPKIPIASRFITEAGLNDIITVHHIRIQDYLQEKHNLTLSNPGSRVGAREDAERDCNHHNKIYNLVFMDADKHNYLNYWKQLQPHLAHDFVVIVDNAHNFADSMKPFVDHCKSDTGLHCEHLDIGTGLFMVSNR